MDQDRPLENVGALVSMAGIARFMQMASGIGAAILAATVPLSAQDNSHDDDLKVYAVHVVKKTPFQNPFTGDGIYLGQGMVITASHVIGRWGFLKDPHILIAGRKFPASIVKEGSLETIDLTLLSIDQERLPVSLLLRRNPLCKNAPTPGESVIGVTPEQTTRYRVVSPLLVRREYRQRFNTLISGVASSGSGVFDTEKRCLLGIISRKVETFAYRSSGDKVVAVANGYAGYFIPAARIADFLPPELRF